MTNERFGAIVLGIADEDEAAAELTPVPLSGDEERRMKQVIGDTISPHLPVEICRIESDDNPAIGYYVLVVPPSTRRPHAVLGGSNLKFPRRDGAITRYLTEAEVAAMYRDRTEIARDALVELAAVLERGQGRLDPERAPWLSLGLIPEFEGQGELTIDTRNAFADWAKAFKQPDQPGEGQDSPADGCSTGSRGRRKLESLKVASRSRISAPTRRRGRTPTPMRTARGTPPSV